MSFAVKLFLSKKRNTVDKVFINYALSRMLLLTVSCWLKIKKRLSSILGLTGNKTEFHFPKQSKLVGTKYKKKIKVLLLEDKKTHLINNIIADKMERKDPLMSINLCRHICHLLWSFVIRVVNGINSHWLVHSLVHICYIVT